MICRTMKYLMAILALWWGFSCVSAPEMERLAPPESPDGEPMDASGLVEPAEIPDDAARPRFSPDGERIAFHAGAQGERNIYVMNADGSEIVAITDTNSDDRDPAWGPEGKRLVFASNRGGSYDLYRVDASGGAPVKIVEHEGDVVEPSVSPLRYAFFAVAEDQCTSNGAVARQIDGYEKVVFTRRYDDGEREEVWFSSLEPGAIDDVRARGELDWVGDRLEEVSEDRAHGGRLSPEGKSCAQAQFSHDGLSVTWSCEESEGAVSFDNEGRWDQEFFTAIEAVGRGEVTYCQQGDPEYDWGRCLDELPRRYTRYEGAAISRQEEGVVRASVSANHVVLTADKDGQAVYRSRFGDGRWNLLEERLDRSGFDDVRNVVWSPDGGRIAFDWDDQGSRRLAIAEPEFYLRDVRNLQEFPELFDDGRSDVLAEQGFVARPGTEREFYALYDKLRYRERPQFVTADAALQAFRDEFLDLLERAEGEAAELLKAWSEAMAEHYVEAYRADPSAQNHHLAVYFTTAYLLLEAADRVERPEGYDFIEIHRGEASEELMMLAEPVVDRMPDEVEGILDEWPETLHGAGGETVAFRDEVNGNLQRIFAHEQAEYVEIPSLDDEVIVDWTQFRPRGPYGDSELAGYFMAMNWYQQLPLPFDESLLELLEAMESVEVQGKTALEAWGRIDGFVGGFMGRPVDATFSHLMEVRKAKPELLEPFDGQALTEELVQLVGEVGIRDATAAMEESEQTRLHIRVFPSRAGLDSVFFTAVTHPNITQRGMVSALDALAALGSEQAREYGAVSVESEYRERYLEILDELREETPPLDDEGYWSTDIYHSWLAAVATLAIAEDVPEDSLMEFAHSDAWRDRMLSSALGGYAQLKHAGVLYAQQSMAVQCGGDEVFTVLVEQPILPAPQGFVDPVPSFFESLTAVAEKTYEIFDHVPSPEYGGLGETENAAALARRLAEIGRRQIEGKALSEEDLRWIEYMGRDLEELTLRTLMEPRFSVGGDSRGERGIVFATDVHTNLLAGEVLQLGVGRIMDMYVAVPDGVGRTMTQGGIFSFYEFLAPMETRLSDEEWAERVEKGELPELPPWTTSFVEEAP